MNRWTILPLLLVLCGAAPPVAQKRPARLSNDDLRAILDKARKKHGVPALGAAVVSSKGLQALAVTGTRKRGARAPVQKTDRFHLGSDTKAMTATLIAILVQKKVLSYDLTLGKAFPELAKTMSAELRDVTLQQLLSHRSGLKANLDWEAISTRLPIREQREKAAAQALTSKPANKPGTKFLYSNLGYVVAAVMAERATKQSWEDLLAKYLAGPLKMTTLGHGAMGHRGKLDQPLQHDEDGQPVEPGPEADNPPVMGPAGNVHCSLADWARFVADQLRGAAGKDGLLSPAAYRNLHEPANKGEEATPGGWKYLRGPGGSALTHDGSNKANYCTALLVPKLDLAVLVVCNQGPPKGQKAAIEGREEILIRLLKR
jgi:CubicO group peptidase (beta-lactamase class C family)